MHIDINSFIQWVNLILSFLFILYYSIYIILIINNTLQQVSDFCWTTKPLNAIALNFLYQRLESKQDIIISNNWNIFYLKCPHKYSHLHPLNLLPNSSQFMLVVALNRQQNKYSL